MTKISFSQTDMRIQMKMIHKIQIY